MWGLMSVIWTEALGFMSLSLVFSWLAGLFLRIGFLELPEQFQIELVETGIDELRGDGAWNHVCLRVADFDECCQRLQAEGIIFETEKLFRKEFWEHGMKFAFFRGPDGERLEIAEY